MHCNPLADPACGMLAMLAGHLTPGGELMVRAVGPECQKKRST